MREKSLARFLGKVLDSQYREHQEDGKVALVEKDKQKKQVVMTVQIQEISESVVVVKLEDFGHVGQGRFAAGRSGLTRVSDYLVVADVEDACWAVFVELKKTLADGKLVSQLRRSLPILCYLNAVHALDCDGSVTPVEVGYLVIYDNLGRIAKPPLKQTALGAVHRHKDISFVACQNSGTLTCSKLLGAVKVGADRAPSM